MDDGRRIIQISGTEAGAANGYSRYLFALCDDGTVWQIDACNFFNGEPTIVWKLLPPIPQEQQP